jgi:RNA polymerase sigma factor (sigma-70 family)
VSSREDLVAGLARRDDAAWREFLREFGPLIFSIAGRCGLDRQDREEVLQKTCLRVLRHIASLRDPGNLASWTYGIALRQCYAQARERRRDLPADAAGNPAASRQQDPPRILERLERLEQVAFLQDALEHLDPRCRKLLTLLYLEEPRPAYGQVGRRMSMPVGSIGPTRGRCISKLERWLEHVSTKGPPGSMDQGAGASHPPVEEAECPE